MDEELLKKFFTSNERGITPRCRDPGVFTPCIVYDLPHLEIRFILPIRRKEHRCNTLFVRRQIL